MVQHYVRDQVASVTCPVKALKVFAYNTSTRKRAMVSRRGADKVHRIQREIWNI